MGDKEPYHAYHANCTMWKGRRSDFPSKLSLQTRQLAVEDIEVSIALSSKKEAFRG